VRTQARAPSVWALPSAGKPYGDVIETPARVIGGRYRLDKLIERNERVDVWEGHDNVLTRPVTIKVLHPALAQDGSFRSHFREESVAAARLSHPNVVATFDTGEESGTVFVVTELVRGRSLADTLAADGPRVPTEAVTIADQIAAALEHGHRAGLVHGAVAPASVFLCDDGLGGTRVKVADFGIAPAGGAGAGDDVRALGAVLYEMLAGQPPAREGGAETPRPRKLRSGIPKPLDTLAMRALGAEPRHRFRSAFDFRRSLAALDLGPDDAEPLAGGPPTPAAGTPAARRVVRRTWVPLVVFVVLAAGAAALVTSVMGRGGSGDGSSTSQTAPGRPLQVSARSFDPEANPATENEERARFAVDGNPATSWATERYRSAHFGRLKNGVGLILTLSGSQRLSRLEVDSSSRNWSAAVYVAAGPKAHLADWGKPVDTRTGVSGRQIFNLASRKGGAVLLWVTDPGSSNQFEVNELALRS
jgi:serine/threonine-protein kinase